MTLVVHARDAIKFKSATKPENTRRLGLLPFPAKLTVKRREDVIQRRVGGSRGWVVVLKLAGVLTLAMVNVQRGWVRSDAHCLAQERGIVSSDMPSPTSHFSAWNISPPRPSKSIHNYVTNGSCLSPRPISPPDDWKSQTRQPWDTNHSDQPTTTTVCGPHQPCCELEHRTWSRTPSLGLLSPPSWLVSTHIPSKPFLRTSSRTFSHPTCRRSSSLCSNLWAPCKPFSKPTRHGSKGPC